MKIGFVGLGKLGLPVATAIAMRGYEVVGYDKDPSRMTKEPQPYREVGPDGQTDFNDHLAVASNLSFEMSPAGLDGCALTFVAVQTPHEAEFEGATMLPIFRQDFDYTHLRAAMRQLVADIKTPTTFVVISTCLPGTIRREVLPLLKGSPHRIVYNPFFIAMGQVIPDFFNPEFILMGCDDDQMTGKHAAYELAGFYRDLYAHTDAAKAPVRQMSIESAELTKVAYNTFIGAKIVFANTLMEICERMDGAADVGDVTGALMCADRRLISPAYLEGGMGDGGGCHPRDNIAMSWLAQRFGLSVNLFETLMRAREDQTSYLASIIMRERLVRPQDPVAIMGVAFKDGTALCDGSPALLLADLLRYRHINPETYDPHVEGVSDWPDQKRRIYFIGCRHPEYRQVPSWAGAGSVIIDPWRIVPDKPGGDVSVIRLGQTRTGEGTTDAILSSGADGAGAAQAHG
jgi:UDPglucose 6-dehydrogenase